MPVLALVHVPPGKASVSVIDEPMHTADGPEMPVATGVVFTVTIAVAADALQAVVIV